MPIKIKTSNDTDSPCICCRLFVPNTVQWKLLSDTVLLSSIHTEWKRNFALMFVVFFFYIFPFRLVRISPKGSFILERKRK